MQAISILFALLLFLIAVIIAFVALIKDIRKKESLKIRRIYLGCFSISILLFLISPGDFKSALLIGSIIMIAIGILLLMIYLVSKLLKSPRSRLKKIAVGFFLIGFVLLIICVGGDISGILFLVSALFCLAVPILFITNVILTIIKKPKKILWLATALCLVTGISANKISDIVWQNHIAKNASDNEIYEKSIEVTYDFKVEDGTKPIEIVTSNGFDSEIHRHYLTIYDVKDFHLLLDNYDVTAAQCITRIQESELLGNKYKVYFCDFVERMDKKYPGMNYAILYHNLSTLEVEELDRGDYLKKSLSLDSLGCYVRTENKIYIPKGTKYIEGEFGYQVLIHEFCHAARSSWYDVDDIHCKLQFSSGNDNVLLEECMNSVFSCSLLSYDEWDIAYQIPSNYMRIMLECMDNYSIEDYMSHGDTFFLSKLDEYTGRTNYAQVMWKLITLQRSDWEKDNIDIPSEEYYPIYDYLCEMYYEKYLSENMTEDEMLKVADELVYKAFYDAPEGYKIDSDYFYEYLEKYMKNMRRNMENESVIN